MDSVCDYLRDRIKIFLSHKGESIRWLARQCEVDYSTVYRLQNGEQKSLSFVNALKIVKYLEPTKYISILNDYYPVETGEISPAVSEKIDELAEALAADLNMYRVFLFAEAEGASRLSVKDQFGKDGLLHLDKLIELEIVSEIDGSLKSNLEGGAYPSEAIVKRVAVHHYSLVSLESPGSFLDCARGGLSLEGVKELYDESFVFQGKVLGIMQEKKGEIISVMSLISGPVQTGGMQK
ncbi:MAG: helix-turn-helix transcriptional regulator [Pseudobdellovibrionaceae bacterium]|nr:helix-turn-helix transcriptional regulator [Pseudobdellovibrionaceae bacterium]